MRAAERYFDRANELNHKKTLSFMRGKFDTSKLKRAMREKTQGIYVRRSSGPPPPLGRMVMVLPRPPPVVVVGLKG